MTSNEHTYEIEVEVIFTYRVKAKSREDALLSVQLLSVQPGNISANTEVSMEIVSAVAEEVVANSREP
jgi:hypothetical protein